MGTRFLLTRASTVPHAVKRHYLEVDLGGTVVTRKVDGMPHHDTLEKSGPLTGFVRAAVNAARFRRLSGLSSGALVRERLRLRHGGRTGRRC